MRSPTRPLWSLRRFRPPPDPPERKDTPEQVLGGVSHLVTARFARCPQTTGARRQERHSGLLVDSVSIGAATCAQCFHDARVREGCENTSRRTRITAHRPPEETT